MICRHCNKAKVNRPRGLCWNCYYAEGVRDLYPSTSKYARRGVPNKSGAALPTTPTQELPGTSAKVQVLIERAERGEELFHEFDAGKNRKEGFVKGTMEIYLVWSLRYRDYVRDRVPLGEPALMFWSESDAEEWAMAHWMCERASLIDHCEIRKFTITEDRR